jgi:hypothetical protein
MRRVPFALHVDEADAVKGDLAGGIAGSPSDPENKQLLDSRTNTQSKSNFVSSAPRNRRANVSIADSPQDAANRLLTGRLSEVDEVRDLADDAAANTRPGLRTNSALRARMSSSPAVRGALESTGVNPDTLKVENPPGVQQFPASGPVNLSPVDADLDPKTGQVVPGPNTSAAQARRAATTVSEPAAPLLVPPPPSVAPAAIPGRAARAAAWTMETAPKVLKVAGQIATVVGAVSEGQRTADLVRANNQGNFNAATNGLAVTVLAVGAGIVDDALAAAVTVAAGSPAPVMDSWNTHNAGPVQHAVGEAYRGVLKWAWRNGL